MFFYALTTCVRTLELQPVMTIHILDISSSNTVWVHFDSNSIIYYLTNSPGKTELLFVAILI